MRKTLENWVLSLPPDSGRTNPRVHYWIWAPVLALQGAYLAATGAPAGPEAIACAAGGLLAWTLLEYILHRFSFHSRSEHPLIRPFNSGLHLLHHRDPSSELYVAAPISLCVPVYALALGLSYALLGDADRALCAGSGLIIGFLAYETVHFRAHLRPARSRAMRYLKKHHLTHHFADETRRFGVTSPIWDMVFGTFASEPVRRSADRRGAGRPGAGARGLAR